MNHLLCLIITHEVHPITINVYLKNIRQYLRDIIDTFKTFGEWKNHLTMKMNFVLTIGFLEYRQMHSKSNNSEIISGFDIDETVEELSQSLVQRCQIAFTNDYCLNCGWSYVDSPGWLKNKKTTKIMKKMMRYAVTAALNHESDGSVQLLQQLHRNIRAWPCIFFISNTINVGDMPKNQK